MNKSSRMADLLAITSRLIACMEREVELLRAKIGRLEAGTPFHQARSRR